MSRHHGYSEEPNFSSENARDVLFFHDSTGEASTKPITAVECRNNEEGIDSKCRNIHCTLELLTSKPRKEVRWSADTKQTTSTEKIEHLEDGHPVDTPLRQSNTIEGSVSCRPVDRSPSLIANLTGSALASGSIIGTCLPSNFLHQYNSAALLTHRNNSQRLTIKERREALKTSNKSKECTREDSPPPPPIEVNFPNFSWVGRCKSEFTSPASALITRIDRNSSQIIPDWYWEAEAERAAMAIPPRASRRHSKIGAIRKPNPYTEHIVPEAYWEAEAIRIGLVPTREEKAEDSKKLKSKLAKKHIATQLKKDKKDGRNTEHIVPEAYWEAEAVRIGLAPPEEDKTDSSEKKVKVKSAKKHVTPQPKKGKNGKGKDKDGPLRLEGEEAHLGFRQRLRAGWAKTVTKFHAPHKSKQAPTLSSKENTELSPCQFNKAPVDKGVVGFRKRNSRTHRSRHSVSEFAAQRSAMGKMTYRGKVEGYD